MTAPRADSIEPAAGADAGFTIRRAEPEDAAAFLAYLRRMGGESQFVTFGPEGIALGEEEEAAYIAKTNALDNAIFLLAVADGEIVGGLTFSGGERPRLRHTGEFGVSVLRAWWGRGVARALLDEMLAWARRSGVVRKINLRVRTDNTRAIRLYERLGFVHEGLVTRDMLIDGRFHDSLLMGLAIDPPGPGSLGGRVETAFSPADLAAALRGEGIGAEVREPSPGEGGVFVHLEVGGEVRFTLDGSGYIAGADADDGDALHAAVKPVSAALGRLGIRHRFELYREEDQVGYLHHDWFAEYPDERHGTFDHPRAERIRADEWDVVGEVHAVLAACGAELARQGFGNWDPPYPPARLLEDVAEREVWAVWMAGEVAATYTLGTTPPHPADPPAWRQPDAPALYLSRLAVLPRAQGGGVGAWCMGQVERRGRELGCRAVRFDVLAANERLRAFYQRLGYEPRGERTRGAFTFACYDKLLDEA